MIIWVDEHLSRRVAAWLQSAFGVEAAHVSELGLTSSLDEVIFERARAADAVLLTKDYDFVELVDRLGPPPRVILLTTGNSSTAFLIELLQARFPAILTALEAGETVVELPR